MVNPQLVERTREILGSKPKKVLVTGGTGFVGSNVAKVIAAAGHHVTVTGRNRYLAPIGKDHQGRNYRTNFRRADLRDAGRISQLCIGQDVVIHSAARSSPFDSLSELESVNVKGTENVICLLYTSPSPRDRQKSRMPSSA